MKKTIILLTIILMTISCNNASLSPNINEDNNTENQNPEIDPNKSNINIVFNSSNNLKASECLPIQISILDLNNNEIPIGQLTASDIQENNIYSKIFTFTPGTYNLILKSNNGKEEIYKNLSFTSGQLESYVYQDINNNQATLKIGYSEPDSYSVLPIDIFFKPNVGEEILLGQFNGDNDEVKLDYYEYGKIFYARAGKYTLRLKSYGGTYNDQIQELNLIAGKSYKFIFIR